MDDPNLLSDFRSFWKCDYYSASQNRSERDKRQLFFGSKMRLYRLNLDPAAGTDSVRFPGGRARPLLDGTLVRR